MHETLAIGLAMMMLAIGGSLAEPGATLPTVAASAENAPVIAR